MRIIGYHGGYDMKTLSIAALIAATLAAPSFAWEQPVQRYYAPSVTINVSCDRGPWKKKVLWDMPTPAFISSLVAAGYDHTTANTIAQGICRDKMLNGRPDLMRQTMQQIYNSTRPGGRVMNKNW